MALNNMHEDHIQISYRQQIEKYSLLITIVE